MGFWGFGVLGFWGFGVLGFWGFGEYRRNIRYTIAMKEQIKLETELESMRQDMSLLVDFDIHNAFHYFDKEGKGYLNTNDINVVLEDLSITPLQDDILLFIRRYDPNLDSKITYQI